MRNLLIISLLFCGAAMAQEDRPIRYFANDPGQAGIPGNPCSVITPMILNWSAGNLWGCVGSAGVGGGSWIKFLHGATGTVAVWSGSGVPGSFPLSVLGDLYINTAANAAYQCFKATACNAVASGNWQLMGSGGGGGFYQTIQSAGTPVTQRPTLNFIQGSNVTLTVADNAGSNRTDITIASTGGGASAWSALTAPSNSLTLNHGAYGTTFNFNDPNIGDPNDHQAMQFNVNFDPFDTTNIGFTDNTMFTRTLTYRWGQNLYGGGTNAKRTVLIDNDTLTKQGGGQAVMYAHGLQCYGMSDCAKESFQAVCAGGPIGGDETSCGYSVINKTGQPQTLTRTTLTSVPVRSACPSNMTTTQTVTAATTVQTVSVSSTTGCANNDWLVVDWLGPTGFPNYDPVQITVVDTSHVSGIFTANHSNGATMRAGVVFNVGSTQFFGQGRTLVDESGATYTTGTVSFANGSNVITGSGTSFTTGMVGGDTNGVGCMRANAEDQTYSPFGSGTNALASWWQLFAPSNSTTITLFSFSVVGVATYNGKSFSGSTYVVRPCATVVWMNGNSIVLSPNTSTWTNGDTVEMSVTPYLDATYRSESVAYYTPGMTNRAGYIFSNNGGQPIQSGYEFFENLAGNNTSSDQPAFGTLISATSNHAVPLANIGFDFGSIFFANSAFRLPGPFQAGGNSANGITFFQTNASIGVAASGNSFGATTGALTLCGIGQGGPTPLSDFCTYGTQLTFPGGTSYATHAGGQGGFEVYSNSSGYDPFLYLHNNQISSGLLIAGNSSSKYVGHQYAQFSGTVISYNDGGTWFPIARIDAPGDIPDFSVLPARVATNGTNRPSVPLGAVASIWNGSAEAQSWAYWQLNPASNATNAPSNMQLFCPDQITITNQDLCLTVVPGAFGIVGSTGTATLDTSNLSTNRTFKLPNTASSTIGTWLAPGLVAALPSCASAVAGARSEVTDATATTLGTTVAGGGANKVPVTCDGTNWVIG